MLKKSIFVLILVSFWGVAPIAFGDTENLDGSCFCRPYSGISPNGYELIYVGSGGVKHFIYAYKDYSSCLRGLNNTALCHRSDEINSDVSLDSTDDYCNNVAKACWQACVSLSCFNNCMWKKGCS